MERWNIGVEILLVLAALLLGPVVLLLGICFAAVMLPLLPVVALGMIIWGVIYVLTRPPTKPKMTYVDKHPTNQPITITWDKKKIPVGQFILMIVIGVITTIAVITYVLLFMPPILIFAGVLALIIMNIVRRNKKRR